MRELSQSHQGAQNVEYPELEGPHMDHQAQFLEVLLYLSWLSENVSREIRLRGEQLSLVLLLGEDMMKWEVRGRGLLVGAEFLPGWA